MTTENKKTYVIKDDDNDDTVIGVLVTDRNSTEVYDLITKAYDLAEKGGVVMYTARAMVHSTNTIQDITVLEKTGDNKYTVLTKDGIKCSAIFNVFTGLYYADDKYGVITED